MICLILLLEGIYDQYVMRYVLTPTHRMTGVKAYVAGRIKVRGDLVLAQKLEQFFEKAGGREVST